MSTPKKADLQRRLGLNVVPAPPADLAERIKRDIPANLASATGAAPGFHLRVAASMIVLLSSVIAAMFLLTPQPERQMATEPSRPRPVPALHRQASETTGETARTAVPLPVPQAAVESAIPALPPAFVESAPSPRVEASPATDAGAFAPEVAMSAPAERERDVSEPERSVVEPERSVVENVPAAAAAPSAPAMADLQASAPPAASARDDRAARSEMKTMTIAAEAPAAHMNKDESGSVDSIFGVSVDRGAFDRIRSAIESGDTPSSGVVDVEALVNYFAGQPTRPPRDGLRLDVEASPVPVGSNGNRAILRITIDAPRAAVADGSSLAVATDASLELVVDPKAVASFRPIGGEEPRKQEAVIHPNASVTMLYELELRPPLRVQQIIATVRLAWTSADDGGRKTAERRISGGDLSHAWSRASRRHRLASLGAVWGETLRGTRGAPDVAKRADELAAQSPGDVRARELATAANASSRLRTLP